MTGTEPARLPETVRKQHEGPKTVQDLVDRESGLVTIKDIGIDRDWGVWINPHAKVQSMPTQTLFHRLAGQAIAVTKAPDGYQITFRDCAGLIANSPANTSFSGAGYVPAVRCVLA